MQCCLRDRISRLFNLGLRPCPLRTEIPPDSLNLLLCYAPWRVKYPTPFLLVVNAYKYLGVHLANKLDWSANIHVLYKKGQSRLYFLRRLRSFNVCNKLLCMFYQSVVASVLFYAVVCWGGSIKKRDAGRLDRLVRRAGAVVGTELDSLTTVADRRTLSSLLTILDNVHHPLHSTLNRQR